MRRLLPAIRDLHLYLGLFLCPFVLVFAVSTLALNHRWGSAVGPGSPAKLAVAIQVPEGPGTLAQAKDILRQLNVTGEIDYVRHNSKAGRLHIPVSRPGLTTAVDVDLRAARATVQSNQDTGLLGALSYLHRKPGPHNARFRGNWIPMAWWGVLTDTFVYAFLFLTVSGIYLWWMLKADRATSGTLLAAGVATVAVLVTALCTV